MRLHQHEIAVRSGDDEHHRRELGLGRRLTLLEPVRVDVSLEVIHADEGQPRRERETPRVVRADQEAPDEPGADRRRDRVDLGELAAGVAESLLGQRVDRAQMLACRHLRNDAARVLVHEL